MKKKSLFNVYDAGNSNNYVVSDERETTLYELWMRMDAARISKNTWIIHFIAVVTNEHDSNASTVSPSLFWIQKPWHEQNHRTHFVS